MDTAPQAGHQQEDRLGHAQGAVGQRARRAARAGLGLAALALGLAACVEPRPRDLRVDERALERQRVFASPVPDPIAPAAAEPGKTVDLVDVARGLGSSVAFVRLRTQSRLDIAGVEGLRAAMVAARLSRSGEPGQNPALAAAALRYLAESSLEGLSADDMQGVRQLTGQAMTDADAGVRAEAAGLFLAHGPGDERTSALVGLRDSQRPVRWRVVRRFGENPRELDRLQLAFVIQIMSDGNLPHATRADALALMLRLHEGLTPAQRPPSFDPYVAPSTQAEGLAQWATWTQSLNQG